MSEDSEKEKANAAFQNGDYATALQHYDKAIENDGSGASAVLFSNKADTLYRLKNYDACIQHCLKALVAHELTPHLKSGIYLRMGAAYESQGKFREAMDAFEQCDRANPAKLKKMTDLVTNIARNKFGGVDFWVKMCDNLLHQADYIGGDTTALTSLMEYLTLEMPGVGVKPSRSLLIAEHNQLVRLCKQISPSSRKDETPPRFDDQDGAVSGYNRTAKPNELTLVTVGDLLLDEVNVGKSLICRTIAEPVLFGSLVTLVEDTAGEVSRLFLHNVQQRKDGDMSGLPIGSYLSVNEPWYKTEATDGQPILRADSPRDVRWFSPWNSLIKDLKWQTKAPTDCPDSWESLQKRGNEFFVAGSYKAAIIAYTSAILLKSGIAPGEIADLVSNRAAAYLGADLPADALDDCLHALHLKPDHLKAAFRMAKASAILGKYKDAIDVLRNSPHTTRPEFQAEISRLDRLIGEQRNGHYDLKSLLKEAAESKTPRLDHADYNGGVEVQWISQQRGNGLVAQRDFAAGDLLFVNKAFAATYQWECDLTGYSSDAGPISINDPTRIECARRITDRIADKSELIKLDDSETPAIDQDRIAAIISHNSIGFIDVDEGGDGAPAFERPHSGFRFHGCGVWLLASFMNHSCLPNTVIFYVGDLMFVRARTAIRKGEELTRCYVSSPADYKKRQQDTRFIFGFKCECELCVCDLKRAKLQPGLEKEREAVMANVRLTSWTSSEPHAKVLEDVRKMTESFARQLAYKDRFDQSLETLYAHLGVGYGVLRSWIKAAKAFEMAYATVVGNGTQSDDTFIRNPHTHVEFELCFKITENFARGSHYAKAKEYFGKMQQAAKICLGSADMELLQALHPEMSLTKLFNCLKHK